MEFGIEAVLIAALAAAVLTALVLHLRLKRRELQVRQAGRRAAEAERLAELGSMTGGLAHEIKNPLSTVVLNAQLLREEIEDSSMDGEIADRVTRRTLALQREAERLREILEDFLQFAGRVKLAPTETDVRLVIDQLVDFFHPQCEKAGVLLREDFPEGGVGARVDVSLLKQAVLNLLINALQAMEEAPGENKELIVRLEGDAEEYRIHVIDQGEGIEPSRVEEIFRPYVSTKSGGSGLGLPTTRRIVEEHGGSIEVHSVEGQGSDFIIRMPVAGPPPEETHDLSRESPSD
ncbi:MAG: ATP-binding protein [Planctomycetota bacterium]|nr:ATP-binding protein [Planctomycetota bacterium]MEC9158482.1 ATP-binding protein [Planctomycetota bacterium]MED5508243.1 ATP-binding protein [Planctomycetota bacterium]